MRTGTNGMLAVIALIGVMTFAGSAQASVAVACNHKICAVHARQPSP